MANVFGLELIDADDYQMTRMLVVGILLREIRKEMPSVSTDDAYEAMMFSTAKVMILKAHAKRDENLALQLPELIIDGAIAFLKEKIAESN